MATQPARKAVITAFGDPSTIQITTYEIEPPPPGHAQVRVLYCGFSGADVNMRLGTYPMQQKPPLTPGYSIVGEIAIGSEKFKKRDLVACLTKYEGQSEIINLPEEHLVPVAQGVDLEQTTALVLDWATAYGMIHHTAKVKSGQRVFIHGLNGAVGYAAAVLAKLRGAEVHGTASERNHSKLKEMGFSPYVYANKDWISRMKEIGGVDAVFDALSFSSWDESYDILNGSGILVGFGANLNHLNETGGSNSILWVFMKLYLRKALSIWRGKTTAFYLISRDDPNYTQDLQALMKMQQAGKIVVPIKKVFELENVQEAHSAFGKLPGLGSILIQVAKGAA